MWSGMYVIIDLIISTDSITVSWNEINFLWTVILIPTEHNIQSYIKYMSI